MPRTEETPPPAAAGAPPTCAPTCMPIGGTAATAAKERARSVHRCARHAKVDALVRCDRCTMQWCEECVTHRRERANDFWICRCGGRCEALPEPAAGERRRYERFVGAAFKAPLSGEGLNLMLVGTACYGTLDALLGERTRATLLGIVRRLAAPAQHAGAAMLHDVVLSACGIAVFLLVLGYQLAWVQEVIRDSARGRPKLDRFPDFTSVHESIGVPALHAFGALAATVGPGLMASLIGPLPLALGVVLAGLGFLLFPMALASVAITGSLAGLDPLRVLRAVRICGLEYALAAALFVAALGAIAGASLFFDGVPWLGAYARAFVILATTAMAAQVLGLVIARRDDELRWLDDLRRHRRLDR